MSATIVTTSDSMLPRLRDDLEIVPQETADGAVFLIRDPRSGRFCRFRETEHFIATQCNGERSPADICERVSEELEVDLPLETLESFLQKLKALSLLCGDNDEAASPAKRTVGGVLHGRVRLFDPDRFLARLLGPLGFVFTEAFFVVSALAIAVAGVVALDNAAQIGVGLSRIATPGMLPAFVLAVIVVTLLHEVAHGLTCKHFGGPVRDIGFLLIYFLPAFYCDVSSAWGFPEKRKRIWVTFAGVWCNLMLWAGAIFVWRISQPDNWIHTISLLVLAVSGVDTFFNFIPLIKLDGYYLLSDALEAPNLRRNSFEWLGGKIKLFFGGGSDDRPEPAPRLRNIYLAYGVAAGLFSTILLAFVAFKLGGFLMSRFHAIGFLLFSGLMSLVALRPLRRRFRGASNNREAKQSPKRRFPWPLRMAVCIGGPIVGVMFLPWELSVVGDVDVHAGSEVEVRAATDGLIDVVAVREGDAVSPGSAIVRLSNPERRTELKQIEADIRKKQAELTLLQSGPKREAISLAKAQLETAQTRHEHANRRLKQHTAMRIERLAAAKAAVREAKSSRDLTTADLKRYQVAYERKAVTRTQCELRQTRAVSAQAALDAALAGERLLKTDRLAPIVEEVATTAKKQDEARRALALLSSPARREEIAGLRADIDRLFARKHYLTQSMRRDTVRSTIAGTITTRQLRKMHRRRVERGDLIAEVRDLRTVRVELSVSEKELADVRVGQPVDVKVLAYPGQCFRGRVAAVSPVAVQAQDDATASRRYIVTTLIDNALLQLKPGMTGKAKIRCRRLTVGRVICRKLSHYVRVEFWSWW